MIVKVGLPVVVLALAAACAGAPGGTPATPGADGTGGSGQAAGPGSGLVAVATVFPLAWLTANVAPGADTEFLGSRGQDPHDLEMSPADRRLLETADVVVYMGDIGFQPQVEQALRERSGPVVSVADVAGRDRLRVVGDDHDDDRGGTDDHGADHDGGVDLHEDDAPAADPHLWFDAEVMADVATRIGEALAAVDRANAAAYRDNAGALHEDLLAVDAELDRLLSDCRLDTAIVSHEAYVYLLAPRGLRQEGISGAGGHGEASPRRLAELVEHIRTEDVPAVLAEPVEGRADAEALAAEAGVELVDIHPLEVVTAEEYATGYPGLLRRQGEAFATALDCP